MEKLTKFPISSDTYEKIMNIQAEIDLLLDNMPELRLVQQKLTENLQTAGSQHNKMVLCAAFMLDEIEKLGKELEKLL